MKTRKGRSASKGPRILLFDIETSPIIANVWRLYGEQHIGVNQIVEDWYVMSWSAKWLDEKPVMYMDQRKASRIANDKKLLKGIWQLLDEADIVITQNGKRFDERKLNAKFVELNMGKPSSFRHIDTKVLAKKYFDLPSYSLEYMTKKFCKKHTKIKSKKFIGHTLWTECMAGNQAAWKEMELYNKMDVLSLEELYKVFQPWNSDINFGVYYEDKGKVCGCGSTKFFKIGFGYTTNGKFQRYRCKKCGIESRSGVNILTLEKRLRMRA